MCLAFNRMRLAGADWAKQQLLVAASIKNLSYDSGTGALTFQVQNNTAHKLISGFPKGRPIKADVNIDETHFETCLSLSKPLETETPLVITTVARIVARGRWFSAFLCSYVQGGLSTNASFCSYLQLCAKHNRMTANQGVAGSNPAGRASGHACFSAFAQTRFSFTKQGRHLIEKRRAMESVYPGTDGCRKSV